MNSLQKLALVSTASALFTASAFAATDATFQPLSTNSVYVSGSAGYATLSTPDKNLLSSGNIADLNTLYGALITDQSHDIGNFGGSFALGFNHAINNHVLIGAETGYDYNGQSKYTTNAFIDHSHVGSGNAKLTNTTSSYDIRLLGTGTYLFDHGISVFGKAGGASVYQTEKTNYSGIYSSSSEDKVGQLQPMLAGGVGYQIKMMNLFVEYSHVFGTNMDTFSELDSHTASVDSLKAGVSYNFTI